MGVGWVGAPAAPASCCLPRVDVLPPSRLLDPFPVPSHRAARSSPGAGDLGRQGQSAALVRKKNGFLEHIISARGSTPRPSPLPFSSMPPPLLREPLVHASDPLELGLQRSALRGCSSRCLSAPGLAAGPSCPSHPHPPETESEHQSRGRVFLGTGIPEALAGGDLLP